MTENQKVELYNRIYNISKHNKLNLGDLREDFVTEIWLILIDTPYEKLTDYYIWRVMMRQRFNKYNQVYKKLFKYNDTITPFVDGEEKLIVYPYSENNENELKEFLATNYDIF